MSVEEAKQLIEQERQERVEKVRQAIMEACKEHNCDLVVLYQQATPEQPSVGQISIIAK